MNREEVRKAAEVMLAFADGKEIQYSHKGENNWLNWVNDSAPHFDWERVDYRIKPESKYRPFLNQEECWNEMHKHPDFGWVVCKETGNYAAVVSITNSNIMFQNDIVYSYNKMMDNYTFTDGEPFGIKE